MAIITSPPALDNTFKTSETTPRKIADVLLELANKVSPNLASYEITLPTTGYTSGTFTIWGESFTGYSITISSDHNGNPLTNFTSGMTEDYPINVSGSQTDFNKLYAFSIGNGNVTFYLTSAPSTAFNVLIKEAI